MRRATILTTFFLLLILTACGTKVEDDGASKEFVKDESKQKASEDEAELEAEEKTDHLLKLEVENVDGLQVFLIDDLFQLIEGDYEFDDMHRSLIMEIDHHMFKLIDGFPAVEHNGLYLPTDEIMLMIKEGNTTDEGMMKVENVFLPISFLEIALGLELDVDKEMVAFEWYEEVLPTSRTQTDSILDRSWTVDEMVNYLSFLEKPIEGAEVSTIPNHLPGAKRAYRNGYHEGIDWYGYATGQQISIDTPIYAMAEGIVVRADHDYEEYPSPLIRNKDLTLTSQLGETPEYIFDRLRGKQVWVQYEKGVMNRFAHLDSIPETLKVGDTVTSETIIGYVGNSGTSGAVNQDGTQLHLHQDILIYGELFWQPFSLEEVKEILTRVFGE